METVNIKSLRADLAEYVKRVEQGEEIVVTRNSKPIMTLAPVSGGAQFDVAAAATIRQGINGGKPISKNSVVAARAEERA